MSEENNDTPTAYEMSINAFTEDIEGTIDSLAEKKVVYLKDGDVRTHVLIDFDTWEKTTAILTREAIRAGRMETEEQ
jgi:hypothetical protein